MGTVVAIGEGTRVESLALGGVRIERADDDDAVLAAWDDLDSAASLLILSPRAAEVLTPVRDARPDLLWVVMP